MRLPLTILLIAVLITAVSAADVTPIGNKGTVVIEDRSIPISPVKADVRYQVVEVFSSDLAKAARQLIGLEPKENKVSVVYGERILAIIPPESKFVDVPVTNECLKFQYGTDNWFTCERLQE